MALLYSRPAVLGHATWRRHQSARSVSHTRQAALLTDVNYVIPSILGEELWSSKRPLNEGEQRHNLKFRAEEVKMEDMRSLPGSFKLNDHGFTLEQLSAPGDIDWDSMDEVRLEVGQRW